MTYDGEGNTTSVAPPGRPAHDFGFSPVELLTSYSPPALPSGATDTTWFYDLDRNLETQTRPGPELVSYGYDTAGRLTSTTADLGTIGRIYDPVTGKLTTLSGPGAITLDFGYDGRLMTTVTWSGAINATLTKTYDDDFFMVEEAVSGASSVLYTYDLDGLGIAAGDLAITRDPDTGLVTSTAASSLTDATGHNGHGEVDSHGASHLGTALYDYTLVRDDIGRIIQKTETVEGATTVYDYGYDLAGRLETVTTDGVLTDTYAYDENGNRLSHDTPTETVFGSYDVQDRLITYGDDSYTFLDSGELSQKQNLVSGDTTDYVYDAFGNLREVVLPDGTLIEYEADGRGRRTAKYVNGVLEQAWLWREQLQPVAELDGAGNVVAMFVYGDSPNVPELVVTSGATYRLIKDHLGSVRLVVDVDTGVVAQRLDYDAWGNVLADTNPGLQPFGFAGGLYDADIGLVRFGARDYDAHTGRWTAKDPMRFDGGDANLYRYASNDPVDLTDPRGLLTKECTKCLDEKRADFDECVDDCWSEFPASDKGKPNSCNPPPETRKECVLRCIEAEKESRKECYDPGWSYFKRPGPCYGQ